MNKQDFEILMNSLYSNNQLFIPQGQSIKDWIDNAFVDTQEQAINYSRCSTQLKDEENHDFKYWYTINRYAKIDDLTFKKDNKLISKQELYKYWRSKINPLIV